MLPRPLVAPLLSGLRLRSQLDGAPSVDRSTGGPLLSQSLTWILAAIVASRLTGMRRVCRCQCGTVVGDKHDAEERRPTFVEPGAHVVGHASAN